MDSFYFVIEQKSGDGEWECLFNRGFLFHGPHDGLGARRPMWITGMERVPVVGISIVAPVLSVAF